MLTTRADRRTDVSQLDFVRLRARGVTGIVFDKDDCLVRESLCCSAHMQTPPLRDELAPELTDAWAELHRVFGPSRILICSNAAGTRSDPGLVMVRRLVEPGKANRIRPKRSPAASA